MFSASASVSIEILTVRRRDILHTRAIGFMDLAGVGVEDVFALRVARRIVGGILCGGVVFVSYLGFPRRVIDLDTRLHVGAPDR